MPGNPFVLGITVYDTDGTSAKASVNVVIRNEANNSSITKTTDSSGKVSFNLANLPSGWNSGDIISYFTLYAGYQAEASFISSATGGTTKTLTLVALPSSSTLRYFTPQEFLDTFNLPTYDSDPNNGLKPTVIVKVGESIEAHMDRLLKQKFDNNSGDYHVYSEEYYTAKSNQRTWYLKNIPVQSIQKFEINTDDASDGESWKDIMYNMIDACDATTDWSASTDGAITLNTTNDKVLEGTGCLNITKTGGTTASVTFSKTLSSSYDFTGKTFKASVYVDDLTELAASGTAIQLRVGSSSSNYYSMNYTKADIGGGAWSTLSLAYDSSSDDAGTTGTPEPASIDYVAVVITYAASSTTVTAGDMRLDRITFNNVEDVNINYNTGRVENLSDNDPSPGKDQVRVTYKQGLSSVPSDIKRLAILMTAQAFGSQALQKLNIDVSEASGLSAAIQNFTNFKKEIEMIVGDRMMPELRMI